GLAVLGLEGCVAGDEQLAVVILLHAAADVDRLAVLELQLHAVVELPVAAALEEEQLPGPGAGDDVFDPVTVEVHQLWTESDASATRDAPELGAVLEDLTAGELRRGGGSGVAVDRQLALAELADEQVGHAVAVEVADE